MYLSENDISIINEYTQKNDSQKLKQHITFNKLQIFNCIEINKVYTS